MGIPSYYRKLKDSVPGLVNKEKKNSTYGLYFDFNCLVYHCLHSMPPYPGEDDRITWENRLIDEVAKYVQKIIGLVNPTHEVLISVDGVVPFAKMKQQRLRRFKAALTASDERWDRNAITPGTAFMERLGVRLHKMEKQTKLRWIVQDASVPGEGEQKIMAYLRESNVPADASIVIYGLDADLIVLSLLMLQQRPKTELYLFRENIEFGEMIYNALGEETYVFLNMNLLEKTLRKRLGDNDQVILNYAMAMNFLGNDFLPHGLSQKMSEEGHEVMMELLGNMFANGLCLTNPDTTWSVQGLKWFIDQLSLTEVRDIQRNVSKKLSHSPPITAETAADFYPAPKVESVFFEDGMGGGLARNARLKKGWNRTYYELYCGGGHSLLAARLATQYYFQGLHWIRRYYLGLPISTQWYYPFFLPPLWRDLSIYLDKQFLETEAASLPTKDLMNAAPQEQLAMVLPMESYWLIRDKALRAVPYKAPQFWPSRYTLFSCGKKWMWECETQIPLLTLRTLRRFIAA